MDEFDFDIFLKEITDLIGHSEKTVAYITERSAILVERFLVSLSSYLKLFVPSVLFASSQCIH